MKRIKMYLSLYYNLINTVNIKNSEFTCKLNNGQYAILSKQKC